MKIVFCQINPTVGDLSGNFQKIRKIYLNFRRRAGDFLLVFPECVLTGYPLEDLIFNKNFLFNHGEYCKKIVDMNQSENIFLIFGSIFSIAQGRMCFNAAYMTHQGSIKSMHFKHALPNYGVFNEKRYFQSGDGVCTVDVFGYHVAVTICEDIWDTHYVESIRNYSPDLLVNISASPYCIGKLQERVALISEVSSVLHCPVAYVNIIGGQDELIFDGSSLFSTTSGAVSVVCDRFKEDCQEIDFREEEIDTFCRTSSTSPPSDLCDIYDASILAIQDYIWKNRFDQVVIGLSGGIDSALSTCFAVDALKKENIRLVTMPSEYTSHQTLNDALQLSKNLGLECTVISIQKIYQLFLDTFKKFNNFTTCLASENIQSRIRGSLLMMIANNNNSIVLCNGNKSEFLVGYYTLYGDAIGGMSVLGDLTKKRVYALARYINHKHGAMIIPDSIFDRPPTAELAYGQIDEDTIPPYDVLDSFIASYIENNDLILGKDERINKKIQHLSFKNEYKRQQSPFCVKFTNRSFGKDWRMPMTNGIN